MSEAPDRPRQRLFALKLSLAATLTLLLLAWVGVEAYKDRRWVETRLTTLARMELAGEEIVRLDEAFTRSARLAVAGGARDPKAPSRQFEEVQGLDSRAPDAGIAVATTASAALAALEDRAFELLRQGEKAEAQRLLSGGEYAAQKEMHAKGMAEFNRNLRQGRDRARVEARAIVRRIAAQSLLTSVLLLFGVWWAVLVERRSHAAIEENNRQLKAKAAELGELNNQLDRKVSERTKDLNESALASLNMMQDAVAAKSNLEVTNKRLQESEERFSGAFEHAPIGMALVSLEGRWLKVNRVLCNLVGYSAAELCSRTFQDITHPDSLEVDLQNVRRMIAGETRSYQMEKRYIHKRGHTISVLLNVSLVRDAHGQPRYFVSQIQDITERKRAEAALIESESRYHSLFGNMLEGYAYCEALFEGGRLIDFTYLEVNGSFERLTGLKDVIGKKVSEIIPGIREANPELFEIYGRVILTGKAEKFETYLAALKLWISVTVYSHDKKNFVAVFDNVTERKHTEEALRESEERFAGAFEHAPIGMALVSPEGRWLKVNRRVCDLLGYSAAELSTRTFQGITHPDDLEASLENVSRIISGEIRYYQKEKRYIHKRGHSVTVLLNVSLVRDAQRQPRYFVAQIQDITEARQAEARYLRQRDALIDLTTDAGAAYSADPAEALQRITETAAATLNVARVSIWGYVDNRAAIREVDLCELASGRHSAGVELLVADYPAYFRALANVEVISADDACRDPRTCEFASGYLQPLGITAMLDAPIQIEGVVEGVLCHEHVGSPRVWTTDEKNFAVAMANLVSLSLEGAARKQAEQALQQSIAQLAMEKARLIAAQAVAKLGSWETDTFTWTVTWSDETHHIFETDPRTFKPSHQDFLQLVHPDDRRMVDEAFMDSLAVSSDFTIEHRVLMKDGRIKFVEERWRPVLDDHGKPLRVEGTCQDITERKQAEAALAAAEFKYRSIYENSTEGIFQTTPDGRFISGNAALARILGYASPEELIHERTDLKRQGYTDPARRDEFRHLIELQGSINSFEYEAWRKDGTRIWISENSRIVRDAAGHVAYYEGSLQDITARKQAERALREANTGLEKKVTQRTAELQTAKELAETADRHKSQFLANMSHELRTPLNAIIGFTGTLLMKLPGAINAQQEEQLEIVRTSARHLLSLINDLLDMAKIESGMMQPRLETVACRGLLSEIAVTLRPQAEKKGLQFTLKVPAEEIRTITDARALKQIVLNLCSNAIKFTDTGSVTIELRQPGDNLPLEIGVTDTGIGIRAEDQDKLFKVFSQVDSTHREGTGLGLHLSQKLAQLINGTIQFHSEAGRGSRFWLTLPLEGPWPAS